MADSFIVALTSCSVILMSIIVCISRPVQKWLYALCSKESNHNK